MNPVPVVIAAALLLVTVCVLHARRLGRLCDELLRRNTRLEGDNTHLEAHNHALADEALRLRTRSRRSGGGGALARTMLDACPLPLLVLDSDGGAVRQANPAAAQLLGRPAAALAGMATARELLAGEAMPAAGETVALADAEVGDEKTRVRRILARTATGEGAALVLVLEEVRRVAEEPASPPAPEPVVEVAPEAAVPAPDDPGDIPDDIPDGIPDGIPDDIPDDTAALRAELAAAREKLKAHKDQIVQSEKMASIGQLAAGVAHEINNPVGYVTSNLGTVTEYAATMRKLLQMYGELEGADESAAAELRSSINDLREEEDLEFILGDLDNLLGESMEGVKRVTEIVQNLKSFAREDSGEKRPYDVNDGVEAMIKMVWNELKYLCQIERDLGEVPVLHCQAGQVNQVIMNMLVNASHAMPEEGGTVTISTRQVGDEVEIAIADDGCGIPPDIVSRIFDPFFTTKDVGKGTGLGLAISHGIITDHGGRIEVDSKPGAGTTFHIFLPVGGETVTEPEATPAAVEAPAPEAVVADELIG